LREEGKSRGLEANGRGGGYKIRGPETKQFSSRNSARLFISGIRGLPATI